MGFLRRRHVQEEEQAGLVLGEDLYRQKRKSLQEQLDLANPAVSFFQSELGEPLRDQEVDAALEVIKKVHDTLNNETHLAIRDGVSGIIGGLRRQEQRTVAISCEHPAEILEQRVAEHRAAGYTEFKGWWDGLKLTDEASEQSLAQHFTLNEESRQKLQLKVAKFEALHMRMEKEGWDFILQAIDKMAGEAETAGYLLGQIHSHYNDEESSDPEGRLNIDRDLCPEF